MARQQVDDRRVRKTQSRLREALVSLIHEKSYDSIVVKEILERADVGRTAFYAHFRDKHALLASGIHQILHGKAARSHASTGGPYPKVLWFSLPILEYVEQFRHSDGVHMERSGRTAVHQHLRQVLIDQITGDVRAMVRPSKPDAVGTPTDLLVEYLVATFLLVLNWWVESRSPLSARQVDHLFLALVGPTLAAEIDGA